MSKIVKSVCIGAVLQDPALFLGVPAILLIRKRLQVCGVRRIEESEVIKLVRVRGGIRFQPHQLQITTTLLLNRLNANRFHVIVRVIDMVIVIFIGIIIATSLLSNVHLHIRSRPPRLLLVFCPYLLQTCPVHLQGNYVGCSLP